MITKYSGRYGILSAVFTLALYMNMNTFAAKSGVINTISVSASSAPAATEEPFPIPVPIPN